MSQIYEARRFFVKDNANYNDNAQTQARNQGQKKKRDLILVAAILAVAGCFYAGNWFLNQKPATVVEITIDGTVVETLDLSKDTQLTINSKNGGTNHIIIQDGKAHISDASCPDKICINQGEISQNGEMIVCLPNLMIAKITDPEA